MNPTIPSLSFRRRSESRRLAFTTWLIGMCVWCLSSLAMAQDKSAMSPSKLRLPKGPGSLEGIGENVDPNLNMGLMSHGIGIDVPEGHNGLTPSLRLGYASGSGTSEIGIGWSLAIPSVERMTVKGLPRYAVDDTMVANGSDELVHIANGVYRARFERGFVRYTWYDRGKEGYFKAEYPDGRIGYFGADSDGTLVQNARVTGNLGTFRYHLVELVDVLGHTIRYDHEKDGLTSLVSSVSYAFEAGTPRYVVKFQYAERPDQISDAKPGFEVRVTRRLTSIQVLVHDKQLRRYQLEYEAEATSGGLSRLSDVSQYGVDDAGPYPVKHHFTYSGNLTTSVPKLIVMGGSTGIDLRTGSADLVDLNGDALPDLLDTGESKHRIWLNGYDSSGAQRFLAPTTSLVGSLPLAAASVEMFDLDGNGFADFVDAETRTVLFNNGQGDWQREAPLDAPIVPNPARDKNLRHFDYNNDRLIDVLHCDATSTWIWANRGNGRFEQVEAGVDAIGAGFVEGGLQLADMNGDGMQDVVQLGLGMVAYRMNLGLGRFAPWLEMKDAPVSGTADDALVDLNGDGLADVVAWRGQAVIYALNKNGQAFRAASTIEASTELAIPERSSDISLRFADMNGSGSTDIVWIDQSGRFSYLELFPDRPNLLVGISNGLGKHINVTYGSSTEHYRRDGGAWKFRLPHPMLTVDAITVADDFSKLEQRQEFHYRDGYYDGVERQFRGFAAVEANSVGDASVESGSTHYAFDVGAADVYKKGLALGTTTLSGGKLISESSTDYADCPVQGAEKPENSATPVRYLCPSKVTNVVTEGVESEAQTLQETFLYDGFGNRTAVIKHGVVAIGDGPCGACSDEPDTFGAACGPQCLGDEQYEETSYIVPGEATSQRWILSRAKSSRSYADPDSSTVAERFYYYDGDAFVGRPEGLDQGLLTRVAARVRADSPETVDLERYRRNPHGAVIESLDPNGNKRSYQYDPPSLLLLSEAVELSGATGSYQLRMSVEYDPIIEEVIRSTAWQRDDGQTSSPERITQYRYDSFGRLVSLARPGDSLEQPSEEYEYSLASPVSHITKRGRTKSGASADLEEITCFDGLGRKLQQRVLLNGSTYQVSGFPVFNVSGESYLSYDGYQSNSDACDIVAPSTSYTATQYDSIGRVLRVRQLDAGLYGTDSVAETTYLPGRVEARDPEDISPSGKNSGYANTPTVSWTDGLGRKTAIERYLDPGRPITTRLRYDGLGNLAEVIDAGGNLKRQFHDLLGRVTSVVDPDAGTSEFRHDAAGQVVWRKDARGRVWNASYDAAGRKTAEWDENNEANSRIAYEYDALEGCNDCLNLEGMLARTTYPLKDDRTEVGEDRFGYDERMLPIYLERRMGGKQFKFQTKYDNAGRVVQSNYPAGLSLVFAHDGAGRLKQIENYVPDIAYTSEGLVSSVLLANDTETHFAYDVLHRLSGLETLDKAQKPLVGLAYERDRVGNITSVIDNASPDGSPSSNAKLTYDPWYRLVEAKLDPEHERAETLSFKYDAVDNILSKLSDHGHQSPDHVGQYEYGKNGVRPHAVTRAGDHTLAYDAAGNVSQFDNDKLDWDYLGRLNSVTRNGATLATFSYGASTDRIKKVEGGQTTYFVTPDFEVRDGAATLYVRVSGQRVAKIDVEAFQAEMLPDLAPVQLTGETATPAPDGEITAGDAWIAQASAAEFYTLPEPTINATVDELLGAAARRMLGLSRGTPQKVRYLHQDQLGSVVAVTDSDGNLVERRSYYPFGLDRSPAPSSVADYTYTGKERDASTGLHYFGARYYSALLGRWTAADPMFSVLDEYGTSSWQFEALGRYVFAIDNPANHVDVDGRAVGDAWYKRVGITALGAVYGTAQSIVPGGFLVDRLTPDYEDSDFFEGQAAGQFATGVIEFIAGAATTFGGGTVTVGSAGTLAVVGVPVSVAGVAIAGLGVVNVHAAGTTLQRAKSARSREMMRVPDDPEEAAGGAAGGDRSGKSFTRSGKAKVKAENAAAHGGQPTCDNCGQPTVPAQQSRAGVKPPGNETHVDHKIPKSKGGNGSPDNGQVLCRDCNLRKGAD